MTIKRSCHCRKYKGLKGRLIIFITLIIIGYFARLQSCLKLLNSSENPGVVTVVIYAYILDNEINCQKGQRFNYEYMVPNCSVLPPGTFTRLVGSYTTSSDKIFFTKNELIVSEFSTLDPHELSLRRFGAQFLAFCEIVQVRLKNSIHQFLLKTADERIATLTSSMLWGRTFDINDSFVREEMKQLGLSHVLAVSGFHLNMVIATIDLILSLFSSFLHGSKKLIFGLGKRVVSPAVKKRKKAGWITHNCLVGEKSLFWVGKIVVLTQYVMIIGISPSILRAFIYFIFRAINKYFLRNRCSPLSVFLIILFFSLIYDPFYLINWAWELSMLASFGLLWSKKIERLFFAKWPKKLGWISLVFGLQMLMLPFLLFLAGEVNPSILWSNLLVVPVIMLLFYGCLWLYIGHFLCFWLWGDSFRLWLVIEDFFSLLIYCFNKLFDFCLGFTWSIELGQNRLINLSIGVYFLILFLLITRSYHVRRHY